MKRLQEWSVKHSKAGSVLFSPSTEIFVYLVFSNVPVLTDFVYLLPEWWETQKHLNLSVAIVLIEMHRRHSDNIWANAHLWQILSFGTSELLPRSWFLSLIQFHCIRGESFDRSPSLPMMSLFHAFENSLPQRALRCILLSCLEYVPIGRRLHPQLSWDFGPRYTSRANYTRSNDKYRQSTVQKGLCQTAPSNPAIPLPRHIGCTWLSSRTCGTPLRNRLSGIPEKRRLTRKYSSWTNCWIVSMLNTCFHLAPRSHWTASRILQS